MKCEALDCALEATHKYIWQGVHFVCLEHFEAAERGAQQRGRPMPRGPLEEEPVVGPTVETVRAELPPNIKILGPEDAKPPRARAGGRI